MESFLVNRGRGLGARPRETDRESEQLRRHLLNTFPAPELPRHRAVYVNCAHDDCRLPTVAKSVLPALANLARPASFARPPPALDRSARRLRLGLDDAVHAAQGPVARAASAARF